MAPRARSSVMQAARKSPDELYAKVQENQQKAMDLHMAKTQMSNVEFKNTRVTTGKQILVKNGKAVAMAFPSLNQKPVDTTKQKSSETTSFSQ